MNLLENSLKVAAIARLDSDSGLRDAQELLRQTCSYLKSFNAQTGKDMLSGSLETQPEMATFRFGLFGLDKVKDPDGTVEAIEGALTKALDGVER